MNIVVLSGKGGTGKTTIAVNLAYIAGENVAQLDCDVEEPNSHLFSKGNFVSQENIHTFYPVINNDKCTHCGKCGKFCRFNAILCTKKVNIVMPELCHDCGGCKIVCPVQAITYEPRVIGKIRKGNFINNQPFIDGVIDTGELSTTKVIKGVLATETKSFYRIIDAPPGSACAAVETVDGADLALIVTEPTPFAFSDMKMVVEMLENMKIPTVVFINKFLENNNDLIKYCKSKELKIIGELPFSRDYGKSYAEGFILSEKFPEVKNIFQKLWMDLKNEL